MEDHARAFQVDLRGVVDLFARHLYSSPRVYLRELLQNGVDAITARQATDPEAPSQIRIRQLPGGGIEVRDTGIGLTQEQAGELLATIGRSSKRDADLEAARSQYIGQFGIGLLSAFMVAEEIDMISYSATEENADPIRWRGYANGSYDLSTISLADYTEQAGTDTPEPGSVVRLRPRPDQEHWLSSGTVTNLAEDFGSLLPIDVAIETEVAGEKLWRRLTRSGLPWEAKYATLSERDTAMRRYCEQALGFSPLTWFDLDLPVAGLSGVAYVLPTATSPSGNSAHRVYLKHMLLGGQISDLLPEWAFFIRCIVDTSTLRPTASREALYEDEVLIATREALGEQVMNWTIQLLSEPSQTAMQFVSTHNLAIRSLALHNDRMLELASSVLPYETTDGAVTLSQFLSEHGQIHYTTTVEEFRRVAPVARAQNVGVVNAGYVYDADLLQRLAQAHPDWKVRPLEAADVEQQLETLPPEQELNYLDLLSVARDALASQDCEPLVRTFDPQEIPAMFITDREIEHQHDLEKTKNEVGGVWGDVLQQFSKPTSSRRLVLNSSNETVEALAEGTDPAVQSAGVQSLYVTAQLLAGEPLRRDQADMMNGALTTLLKRSLGGS